MPNPVTVVSREEVSIIAPTNLVEGLAELPQFYGSNTTQSPGNFFTTEGAGSLNLRGLQSKRTLQLLNGRRVVQSTIFGGPDINLFPESVISSVETVTGGASAAYGTDAVAGAVNFILDTDFEGIQGQRFRRRERPRATAIITRSRSGPGSLSAKDTHLLVSLEKTDQDADRRRADSRLRLVPRARALLENTAPGAGTTPDNPFYVPDDRFVQRRLLAGRHFPSARRGRRRPDSRCERQPVTVRLGSPCARANELMGCSTVNGGSGVDSGVPGYQISPDSGQGEPLRLSRARLRQQSDGLRSVHIAAKRNSRQRGNAGTFRQSPGRGRGPQFHDLSAATRSFPPASSRR